MYDLSDSIKRHENAGIVCPRCEHNKANGIQPTPHAGYDYDTSLQRHYSPPHSEYLFERIACDYIAEHGTMPIVGYDYNASLLRHDASLLQKVLVVSGDTMQRA